MSEYIRTNSRKSIKIPFLAEKLGLSDRTIQGIIRQLEKEGTIKVVPLFSDTGRQQGNVYTWTDKTDPKIGGPTLERLYARYDSYGFRSFSWEDYKMMTGLDNKLTGRDYDRYIEVMDAKKRLKRKNARSYRKNLRKLHSLKVRDGQDKPL